jgi:hypothetical protein
MGRQGHRACVFVAVAVLALGSGGCDTIRAAMPAAKRTAQLKEQMDQLQARSMRFADEYVGRVIEETAKFTSTIEDPEVRYLIAGWRLSQANAAYANASGPSPVVNALDLVTLATLSRMVVEDSLLPLYPDTGRQLLETHRDLEKTAWTLCDEFLTPGQIADFHSILDEWRAQHPKVSSVAFIHFLDFARQIGRPRPGEAERSGGLFAMLGLDPLAGLDPAVREIEQTRALAERTIYYLQRVPYVLNLQFERVTGGLLARPETRDLLRDSAKVAASVERFSQVAAALPGQISAERVALIDQLSGELVTQQQTLRPMLNDLKATLDSGSQTAQAIDATVRSLDALMARFPAKAAPAGTTAEPSRPFDIREYAAAAAEFTRTANELRGLITSVDAQSPALASSIAAAVDRSESLIDYLFLRAAALIVLAVAAVLGAALLYRKLSPPRPAR